MLRLFKIKKSQKIEHTQEIADAIEEVQEEIEPNLEPDLPQIKLFISVDQLSILKEKDEERENHAQIYLNSVNYKKLKSSVLISFEEKFVKGFSKLGNENKQCPHCRREYTSIPAQIKKCLGCGKGFYKTKRPQDGLEVLVKEEDRKLMKLQWENIKKAELIEGMNLESLERARLKLEQKYGTRHTLYDAHFLLVKRHISMALKSGRFRLYTSLMYYMTEQDRFSQKFAKALGYYFYLYYLHHNGASNSVVFGDRVMVNIRISKRIHSLLQMAKLQTIDCEELFKDSVESLTVFELENMPYSIENTYAHLVKSCEEAEGRKIVKVVEKPKEKARSFRLQR
jgi:hypothetical protein